MRERTLRSAPISFENYCRFAALAARRGDRVEFETYLTKLVQRFSGYAETWRRLETLGREINNAELLSTAQGILRGKTPLRSQDPEQTFSFKQTLKVERMQSRLDLIFPLCKGKKVLHVGCTDYPIFDPASNLHLQLAPICRELHGLDIDVDGLTLLAKYHQGRYFNAVEQITEHYDLVLVPETIEHVDSIRGFLEGLSKIRFDRILITGPNAFLPNDNNSALGLDGSYTEYVHPDHKCWFSPYTLQNCIKQFTDWEPISGFLLENDIMAGVLCRRQSNWHLREIPKKAHLYWGNQPMSWLRFLTFLSLSRLNPDWEINVYFPSGSAAAASIPWDTGERYDNVDYSGRDYTPLLDGLTNVKKHEVSFDDFPFILEAAENFKSDFFRWWVLSEQGGIYVDADILFAQPLSDLYFNRPESHALNGAICLQEYGNIIGFLASSPGNPIFKNLMRHAPAAFTQRSYQSISAPLVNSLYPSMETITQEHPGLQIENMPMSVVYPWDHVTIGEAFEDPHSQRFTDKSIGIHWYAGHQTAQKYNGIYTPDNMGSFQSAIARIARRFI